MGQLSYHTRMQELSHGALVPVVLATTFIYPVIASLNIRFLNFNGLALMSSLIMFIAGFAAVNWLFIKVDTANDRKYYHHKLDSVMSTFRSVHSALFLFVVYRAFLCAYLNVDIDTILPEQYLLARHGAIPAFNFDHTISVYKALAIWFPALSAVGYLALNVARRFTR